MHSKHIRPRLVATLLAALAGSALSSLPAATITWTSTASGNWSDGANWSTNPAAPATSGDDIIFNGISTTITSTVDAPWSVNSLSFTNGSGSISLASGPLTLGAGGITNSKTAGTVTLSAPLVLGANQTWSLAGSGNAGRILVGGNFSGSGNITKSGGADLVFGSGNSDDWTGSFTLESGTVTFNAASQVTRLGSNTTTMRNTATSTFLFNTAGNAQSSVNFANDIVFADTGSGAYNFSASNGTQGVLNLTGNLSSTGALGEAVTFTNGWADTTGSVYRFRLSGDNSGLTSSRASTVGADGAVAIRNAFVTLASANALGAGNGLVTSVGEYNHATANRSSGLFTTNGNNVGATLHVRANANTGSVTQRVYLGLEGAGAAAFTGNIVLQGLSGAGTRGADVYLRADAGGRATFSGIISNSNDAATNKTENVFIEGLGTVVLSGANTYTAKTTVGNGATLLVNNTTGSGTGVGAVEVQSGGKLGGTGRSDGAIALLAGASLTPGDDGVGTFTSGASFTWSSNGTSGGLLMDLGATPALSDTLAVNGAFTKGTGSTFLFEFTGEASSSVTYTLVTFGSNDGFVAGDFSSNILGDFALTGNSLTFTVAAIPEPSTFAALMGMAVLGLAVVRSRRPRA